jgi:hypothetical protein
MEPTTELFIQPGASRNDQAMMSIAISLKRIADALNYQQVGSANLFDLVRAISEKNY